MTPCPDPRLASCRAKVTSYPFDLGNTDLTNTISYSGRLLSLLWRPALPTGWSLVSVFGDGNPETVLGEMVWTGSHIPPSPITLVCTVAVPPNESGTKEIHGEVKYHFAGMANAASGFASPDPLVLVRSFVFGQPWLEMNGPFHVTLHGDSARSYAIEASTDLIFWTPIATNTLGPIGLWPFVDSSATNFSHRFYRALHLR